VRLVQTTIFPERKEPDLRQGSQLQESKTGPVETAVKTSFSGPFSSSCYVGANHQNRVRLKLHYQGISLIDSENSLLVASAFFRFRVGFGFPFQVAKNAVTAGDGVDDYAPGVTWTIAVASVLHAAIIPQRLNCCNQAITLRIPVPGILSVMAMFRQLRANSNEELFDAPLRK